MPAKQKRGEPVHRESAHLKSERLLRLKELFPEIFTEGDQVDPEKFQAFFADALDEGPERYSFTWAGKKDALRLLQTPTRATLVPRPKESVDFDTTQNLFLEGENLEVLKLLYKAYFGRVKMIYIDPPYNTGHDFIYPDDYKDPLDTYLKLSGQQDEQGNLLTSKPNTNGRFHSAWLSMMYPRLFLARQLLRDDGVIFISIDDNEVHNLRMIMNEIFGEENFIETIIWKKRATPPNDRNIGRIHEYIMCYSKSENPLLNLLNRDIKSIERYSNPDDDPKGNWVASDLSANGKGGRLVKSCIYPIKNPDTQEIFMPSEGRCWLFNKDKMSKYLEEGRIGFRNKTGAPFLKRYLSEVRQGLTLPTILTEFGFSSTSALEVDNLFEKKGIFEYAKPTTLVKAIIKVGTSKSNGDVVLDFFAGSGTTADAVMQQNIEDGGNRKWICVQLPEKCKEDSEACRAGYKSIADIGKERIRRAIAKLKSQAKGNAGRDLGFKVFRLAESHYKSWIGVEKPTPEAYLKQMEIFKDPLNSGWKNEDLIYEVALKEGFSLSCTIEQVQSAAENTVYLVTDPGKEQSFYICLDDTLKLDALTPLSLNREKVFVCRDAAMSDEVAANLSLQCRLRTI